MPAVIDGTEELSQIVNKKIATLHLLRLWEEGDYHFVTIAPGLLVEFCIQYSEESNPAGIRDLCFVVSYFGNKTSDKVVIAEIAHFRTYTHKQLVREIHKSIAKEMFRILGESGEMVFDGFDYFKAMKTLPKSEEGKQAEKARKDFHRGQQYVRVPFKALTLKTVQF